MSESVDPIANRLQQDPLDFIAERLVAAGPEVKQMFMRVVASSSEPQQISAEGLGGGVTDPEPKAAFLKWLSSSPELKQALLDEANEIRRWCVDVLRATEIVDFEGRAVFGATLDSDTAERLRAELRRHPERHREALAPFRSYAVPPSSGHTRCFNCDQSRAAQDADGVAESVRHRLGSTHGHRRHVVRVVKTPVEAHDASSVLRRLDVSSLSEEVILPVYATYVIEFEEAG